MEARGSGVSAQFLLDAGGEVHTEAQESGHVYHIDQWPPRPPVGGQQRASGGVDTRGAHRGEQRQTRLSQTSRKPTSVIRYAGDGRCRLVWRPRRRGKQQSRELAARRSRRPTPQRDQRRGGQRGGRPRAAVGQGTSQCHSPGPTCPLGSCRSLANRTRRAPRTRAGSWAPSEGWAARLQAKPTAPRRWRRRHPP